MGLKHRAVRPFLQLSQATAAVGFREIMTGVDTTFYQEAKPLAQIEQTLSPSAVAKALCKATQVDGPLDCNCGSPLRKDRITDILIEIPSRTGLCGYSVDFSGFLVLNL